MKRKIKTLITAFAVCAVSAFAVMASGCMGVPEWLEQARCMHKWNDGEVTKEATCEDVGEKTVTCTLCGYEDIEYIPATGHAWINTDAVEPTCTQVGQMAGIRCATCAEWFIEATEVPATGHIDVTDTGKAATCTETGLTDGSHCGVCNEILTAQEEIPANGHNVVTVAGKEPTCTEAGLTDREVCETCGVTLVEQEEIPMVACADEDGDGYCDMCNIIMPLAEGTYTEVAATAGETVGGNWYRIYYPTEQGIVGIVLTARIRIEEWNASFDLSVVVERNYANSIAIAIGSMTYAEYIYKDNSLIKICEGNGYYDVYFGEGSFAEEDFKFPPSTVDLTMEESLISEQYSYYLKGVYRLQVNEGGEVAQPDDVVHPAEGTYTEVAATVGETVAGNWYRVYLKEHNGTYYPGVLFNFEGLSFGFRMATMVEPAGVFLSSTTIVEIPNTLVIIQDGENDKGIYADFYFNIGSCTYLMPMGERALNITEETTITSIAGEVYRLQVNE